MKHLSMWLAVSLLGALPLTAMAGDYDLNRPLLAAENVAPQLPGAPESTVSRHPARPDLAESGDETPDNSAPMARIVTPSTASPAAAAPRSAGPSANNTRSPAPPKPATQPDPAAWRSLLPGSIQ